MKFKSDAVDATKRFLADVSLFGGVRRLRCGNGTEYSSLAFRSLMINNKIKQEFSAPYSPHKKNGTAERNWRSLMEMARCLLLDVQLPKSLWNCAVRASAYIRNRCFNKRTGKTPYECFTGNRPNVSNMHVFGTKCYGYVQGKSKFDSRCEEGYFLGQDPLSPASLVYIPDKKIVKGIRCVRFSPLTVDLSRIEESEGLEIRRQSDLHT